MLWNSTTDELDISQGRVRGIGSDEMRTIVLLPARLPRMSESTQLLGHAVLAPASKCG